jgi:hypothetical protein
MTDAAPICNRCRKNEARPGWKSCESCGIKAARNMRRVRVLGGQDHKAKQKAWKRESFARRMPALLASGTCLHCQCRPAAPGLRYCLACLTMMSGKPRKKS